MARSYRAPTYLSPPVLVALRYGINLNGTLDIMFQNGFTPSPSEMFTIFTFTPGFLNGEFSNITWDAFDNAEGYFTISYNDAAGDVVITAEAIPEPATLLLMPAGLGVLLWWIGRRSHRRAHCWRRARTGLRERKVVDVNTVLTHNYFGESYWLVGT